MTSHRDDDALGWAGDDDPTLASGSAQGRRAPEVRPGAEPEAERAPEDAPDSVPEPGPAPGTGPETEPEPEPEVPDGWSIAGPTAAVEAQAAREAAAPASSAALIALGIFAGIYLLYTLGWFFSVGRIENPLAEPVARFMFSLGLGFAVAAPAAWFGTTYWFTSAHGRARISWLLAGAVLLAPLPIILGTGGIS
ncbi:hypothetical protein [Cryobacterium tagatosivorans]|uniref:DNA polymerase III subunit gamma/tau n=1 Tax=Cryobacterium tagatosivorans TaxID=1259199 RepID=A0A4R8UCB0_9MICO|nr:hypothetical protein [Cryobacterium tagatosivorans]TFB48992.1 hypothetical protein E3O23_12285 [Cryobacterium tagatosivorans]